MPAAVLLVFLLAGLLALVPVWRLRVAGWPAGWLAASWATYGVLILLVMRFVTVSRFLLPILVVLYVAPFVAGPERLARLLRRGRTDPPRPVKDVTPEAPRPLPATRRERMRSSARSLHADPPGGEAIDVFSTAPARDETAPAEGEAS